MSSFWDDPFGHTADFVGGLWEDVTGQTAAKEATNAATAAAQNGIDAQMQMFNAMQGNLSPYMEAGTNALSQQQALSGALGPEAQQAAYDAIQVSPAYTSALAAGENSILQNASATGGLRGGNTQSAMAQFAPQLLSSAISNQYNQLGGLSQLGQASAAGVGSAGLSTGQGISNSYSNMGDAQAAGAMAQYQLPYTMFQDLSHMALQGASMAATGGF